LNKFTNRTFIFYECLKTKLILSISFTIIYWKSSFHTRN